MAGIKYLQAIGFQTIAATSLSQTKPRLVQRGLLYNQENLPSRFMPDINYYPPPPVQTEEILSPGHILNDAIADWAAQNSAVELVVAKTVAGTTANYLVSIKGVTTNRSIALFECQVSRYPAQYYPVVFLDTQVSCATALNFSQILAARLTSKATRDLTVGLMTAEKAQAEGY